MPKGRSTDYEAAKGGSGRGPDAPEPRPAHAVHAPVGGPDGSANPQQGDPGAPSSTAGGRVGRHSDAGGASAANERLDYESFATHFRTSFRVLWQVAYAVVGDRITAEDVVQDSALVALDKLGQYTPGTDFTAWMAQTVRYVALNAARKRQRRKASPIDPEVIEQVHAAAPSGSRVEATGRTANAGLFAEPIARALESVGDVPRACLLLRTVEGLDYAKIAEILSIPPGTAMSHVHRTRQVLRQRLAELHRSRSGTASQPDSNE